MPRDLFWHWIRERHSIYLKRARGAEKPWTDDAILRDFKFTNVFRELDRGTVWLRENFLEPHRDDDLGLIAFNICWYRMFNWTGTGEVLGWQTSWEPRKVIDALQCQRQVFTGAHIVYSTPGMPKLDCIVNVCNDLFDMCMTAGALETCAREERSLRAVFEGLIQVDCVGPFMAYEMVTDMRHTRLLEDAHDIMTWANAGPGAIRGLRRLEMPHKPQSEACKSMRDLLEMSNVVFAGTHVPSLEMRDIEHSLCEFDKYCRAYHNEGTPRSRYNGAA